MTKPLSPAAQAVLDAAYALPLKNGQPSIAAAIHVLADQAGSAKHWHVDQLRAIAAELEGGATTTTTPQEAQ
jgi:hypothetical protein